jgi:hypothetical protein
VKKVSVKQTKKYQKNLQKISKKNAAGANQRHFLHQRPNPGFLGAAY